MQSLLDLYKSKVKSGKLSADAHQEAATMALQRLHTDLTRKRRFFAREKFIQGVYIYGGVGRGKSMLMDMFYDNLPAGISKRRVHFHEFMIETHDWLHQRRQGGSEDERGMKGAECSHSHRLCAY